MDFRVPQFIEHDPKILGPFTLSQALYIGAALVFCFFLKFYIGNNFFLYMVVCGLIVGGSLALAFMKIEGLGLPAVGKNLANFSVNSKLYIWKRKESPVFLSSIKQKQLEAQKNQQKQPNDALKASAPGKIDSLSKKINYGK